ncbi:MAG: MFS transporter [DPANN group archaeon]|nr:MFS transporter [DPANN group archaeon]
MKRDDLKHVGHNIILLGIVSFLNDLSSEMIMPILPLFIASLGGGGLAVGLISGLRESIASILKILSGWFSDRTGRRKALVFSGYLTSASFKLLLAFSTAWQQVLIFTGLERVGKGLRTAPRDAIISDSLPAERGRGFGIHRAMDTAGAVVGSLAVFFLFWSAGLSFVSIILIAAVFSFFSLIPLAWVKEKKAKPRPVSLGLGLSTLPKDLRKFILVSSVFSLANFSYMFFILRTQDLFTGKLAVGVPILLYVLFNIFYALFAIPFGSLSDRLGRRTVIAIGYVLFSLTALGFVLFDSLAAFIILFALYGISYAIIDGNQRAYVADLSSKRLRATALGTFHAAIGLSALPAGLMAGLLWKIAPGFTFLFGSLVSLVSAMMLLSPFLSAGRSHQSG